MGLCSENISGRALLALRADLVWPFEGSAPSVTLDSSGANSSDRFGYCSCTDSMYECIVSAEIFASLASAKLARSFVRRVTLTESPS